MSETEESIQAARQLLAGRFCGILATQSLELPGYPFGSLVAYSLDTRGEPLMLLSHLAKHSRNLAADPRCNLTLSEQGNGDCQQLARLSCLGTITPTTDLSEEAKNRHFRYFPQSRPYYEQLNFQFYRFLPERFYWVGGFGAARWLDRGRLSFPERFSPEEEERLGILIEEKASVLNGKGDKVVGIDNEGVDLLRGERLQRLPISPSLNNSDELKDRIDLIFKENNNLLF